MTQTGSKILFIGFDAGEPELMLRWAREGVLPHFNKLLRRSVWCQAVAPNGFGNGVVWPSLYTGTGPATHGRYFYRQLKPGSYDIVDFKEDDAIRRPPFWQALSEAGKRVGIVDVVRAPLVPNLHGFQIADWMTHDASGPMRSWPPDLAAQVVDRLGADPIGGNADRYVAEGAPLDVFRDGLCRRIEAKTRFICEQLDTADYDMLFTVYGEPHDVGHLCWHLHDSNHVRYRPELAQRYGDPVRDVMVALDKAIGALIQHAGSDTTVALFTGPGMGPAYTGNYMLDDILKRLDGMDVSRQPNALDAIKNTYKKYVPVKWRRRVHQRDGGLSSASDARARATRRFFQLPHNQNAGAIRINLEGREPAGRVRAVDYDAVCDELESSLREIVNITTGESIVADIVRVRKVCQGPQRDHLPDLLVVWNRPVPIVTVESPRIGRMTKEYGGVRTGDHTPHCLFLMTGPGVGQGYLETPIAVQSIAPTLAEKLSVTLRGCDAPSQLKSFLG